MEITPELRNMIHKRVPTEEFRREWLQQGGVPLREEGLVLAVAGKTTLEEVLSATHSEVSSVGQAPARRREAQVASH